jgi:putative copper export protein
VRSSTFLLAHAASGGAGTGVADARAVVVGLAFAGLAAPVGPAFSGAGSLDRWRGLVARAAPAAAVAAGTDIHLHRGMQLVAIAAAAAAVVVPDEPRWRPLPAAVVLAAVTSGAGPGLDLLPRMLGALHVLAAASWLGLVVEMAVLWRRDVGAGRRTAMRLATPAVVLVAVAAATGTLIAADHLGDARLALSSWWGRGLALKVALVVGAALVGALVRRGWAPRLEGSLLAAVATIGLGLAAVGGPLAGAAGTGPLFAADDAGHASVVVTPLAPGRNTVLVRQPRRGPAHSSWTGTPSR